MQPKRNSYQQNRKTQKEQVNLANKSVCITGLSIYIRVHVF